MLVVMLVLSALDQTIVATALPSIVRELHNANYASWVFSSYLLAATVAVPLYGRLADLYGSKPIVVTAIVLFLAGSLLSGISSSMLGLIWARALQGAGGGGLLTLAMTSVAHLFAPSARSRLQGLLGAAYGLSVMVGPLLGGFLVEHASWHWAFLLNLPIGVVALAVLLKQFPRQKPTASGSMDYAGAVLLSAALVSLLLSTRSDTAFGLAPLHLAGLAAVLMALFLMLQARLKSPLFPLGLFAQRGFSAATLLSVATGFTFFTVVVFMPQYFQSARGINPSSSGLYTLPLMAGVTAASIAAGRLLAKTGRVRSTALLASAMAAAGFAVLGWLVQDPAVPLGWVSACLVPVGAGIGALFPLVTVVSQTSAPPALIGIATASSGMFRAVSGAVSVAVMGALLERGMLAAQALPSAVGAGAPARALVFGLALSPVMWVSAAIAVLTTVVAAWLPARLKAVTH